jgi:hypothetical protein
MHLFDRALRALGIGPKSSEQETLTRKYQQIMSDILRRMRLAELQLQEATSLEELDIARSALLAGMAEVQQLIRTAKRDRGIAVRPIAETEELHRNLRVFMNKTTAGELAPTQRKTGTEL